VANDIVEEGLSGRTSDVDDDDRAGANGRTYFRPFRQTHHPLDVVVVVMRGTNDLKTQFDRSAAAVAHALNGYIDDVRENVTHRAGWPSAIVRVSPIRLDDSGPRFRERSGADFDHAGVEKSARHGAEIPPCRARARGLVRRRRPGRR
jgi:hypothetical protein